MRPATASALEIAVVLLLALPALPLLHPPSGSLAGEPARAGGIAPAGTSSPCGAIVAGGLTGTLHEYGNLSPVPTVSGVALEYNYTIEASFQPSGSGSTQITCPSATSTATTNATGGFSLTVSLPTGGCTQRGCTSYSGPYGPASFATASAPPAGYFVHGSVSGHAANVSIAVAYASLVLSPATPILLSVNASTPFTAQPYAADGSPSPVVLSASWQLGTAGWRMQAGPSALAVRVVASDGAGPALLGLWVNGSYGGHAFSGVLHGALLAASTRVASEALVPVPVDVGGNLTLSLGGAGAPGYRYRAIVAPGLGVAPLTVNCTTTGAPVEEVAVACAASWSYPASGTAHPSVELTNGFSNASELLGSVGVNPHLELALAPHPLATYVDDPLPLSVRVVNGTGSSPYGPACVDPGTGFPICSTSAGPVWYFALAYPGPGHYRLSASVADAAQAQAQAVGTVVVAAPPLLFGLAIVGGGASDGQPTEFVANLSGGIAPVSYWWNASRPNATFASGTVAADGAIGGRWTPGAAGVGTITLTCVDALGTRIARELQVYVEPGPAVALALAGAPFPSVGSAGVGVPLSLEGIAPDGARVTDFASALTVEVGSPSAGAPIYLNGSLGAIYRPVDGAFALPVSAWIDGYLNVSFVGLRSGRYTITLDSGLPLDVGSGGPLSVTLGADPFSLALGAVRASVPGTRSNATEYRLSDGFGNPGGTGAVWVDSRFGGGDSNRSAPVVLAGNLSYVWINYSAPSAAGGTVRVWSSAGRLLLGPLSVPAAPAEPLPVVPIALGSLAGLGVLVGALGWVRRGRPAGAPPEERRAGEASEEELRREAAGRARLLERLGELGPSGLERLRADWPEPVPDRSEMVEWLAALATDGSVAVAEGPAGAPVYTARVERPAEPPRVELDRGALERALAQGELDPPEREAGPGRGP